MDKSSSNRVAEARATFNLNGAEVVPARLIPASAKTYRAKVFKSGNSLAVRMPKALGLEAGMEMDVTLADDGSLVLRKAAPVKRKFDIDKVAGSATSLRLIDPDDRWFEERKLDWGNGSEVKLA